MWRNGQSTELQAKLGEAPENPQVAAAEDRPARDNAAEAVGLHFGPVTNDLRRDLRLGRDTQGVVITEVDDDSAADRAGLTRGDVVMSINQQPVNSPAEAAQKLKEIANSPQKTALLLLNRRGTAQYLGIDLGKQQG